MKEEQYACRQPAVATSFTPHRSPTGSPLTLAQVLLYKDQVDGPLGAYLSMRDIKPEASRRGEGSGEERLMSEGPGRGRVGSS